ncbi:hypothetical protein MPP7335_04344 [Mycolicibacterium parafortuitum]|nr:hypothetical protein MPP7335_04344 [Mycolicibacterium parafortuitum]
MFGSESHVPRLSAPADMFIPRRGDQAGYRDAVPEPLRIALRPLSLVLMLAGLRKWRP